MQHKNKMQHEMQHEIRSYDIQKPAVFLTAGQCYKLIFCKSVLYRFVYVNRIEFKFCKSVNYTFYKIVIC